MTMGTTIASSLRGQQHLGRAPVVHRSVALGGLAQRESEVDDLAGVDLAVPDQVDQLGEEPAHGCGATVEVGEAPEHVHSGYRDVVGDADEADVPAGTGCVERLHHRLLRPDRLDDGVRSETV